MINQVLGIIVYNLIKVIAGLSDVNYSFFPSANHKIIEKRQFRLDMNSLSKIYRIYFAFLNNIKQGNRDIFEN